MIPQWAAVLLAVAGAVALAAGVGFIYMPAGMIAGGALALAAGASRRLAGGQTAVTEPYRVAWARPGPPGLVLLDAEGAHRLAALLAALLRRQLRPTG